MKTWNGGQVYVQSEYPSLLFAKDGEIFELNGLRYIVIGGAYSVEIEQAYRGLARYACFDSAPSGAQSTPACSNEQAEV